MSETKITKQDIREGAPFAVLSYVFFLWILTFIFKKENPFANFHARQGIVIFVGHLACLALMIVPFLRWLGWLAGFALACASLYGIVLSLSGKKDRIFLISDFADKIVI